MSLEPPRQPDQPEPGEPREAESQPRADVVRVALRLPTRQPVVVYALLGITILTYVLQLVSQAALGGDYPAALGMKYNAAIIAGEYWRLLTPMLLHGSITHLLFNMYALFSFGRELERIYAELDRLEPVEQDARHYRPQVSLAHWPLGLALLLSLALAARLLWPLRTTPAHGD